VSKNAFQSASNESDSLQEKKFRLQKYFANFFTRMKIEPLAWRGCSVDRAFKDPVYQFLAH